MKKLLSLFLTATSVLALQGQSLLWEISGKNLDSPSYLYGTIHIQDKRVFALPDTVWSIFKSCDAYAMEVLLSDIDPKLVQEKMLLEKTTLKELFTPEEYAFVDSMIKDKLGMSAMAFNKMKPFFISAQMMKGDLKKEMPLALDMYLLDEAKKLNKKPLSIEKFEEQIAAVDAISPKEQAKMLLKSLKDTSSQSEKFEELISNYLKQDLEQLMILMNDTSMPENFTKEFLDKRNKVMAKNIAKYSAEQKTFNAVGAAHLGGEKGVIALLRQKGYSVKPVEFSFNEEK